MPCLVALIVLSIGGIFSAANRKLAKEAFDCVFRRVTLRPCNTGFDVKIKSIVLGKIINLSPALAKMINRYFEIIAWVLVILMTVSSVYSLRGIYNYYAWGNCNGPNTGGFCAFDPQGENNKTSAVEEGSCVDGELAVKNLNLREVELDRYPVKKIDGAKQEMVVIGCYNCEYTRQSWDMFKQIAAKKGVNLRYIHFPTKTETKKLLVYDECLYQLDEGKYWLWVDRLFSQSPDLNKTETETMSLVKEMGFEETKVTACIMSEDNKNEAERKYQEIKQSGLYGTPTVFIDNTPVVGPKPARVYERLLRGSWF